MPSLQATDSRKQLQSCSGCDGEQPQIRSILVPATFQLLVKAALLLSQAFQVTFQLCSANPASNRQPWAATRLE